MDQRLGQMGFGRWVTGNVGIERANLDSDHIKFSGASIDGAH